MLDTFPQGDAYAIHDEPIVPLGECVRDSIDGLLWSYLKAGVALVEGQPVAPSLNIVTETDIPAAVNADTTIFDQFTSTQVGTLTTALVPTRSDNKEYAILKVTGGTGEGQSGVITQIDGTNLTVRWRSDNGRLTTALDTTSDVAVLAYWLAKAATTSLPVIGVAQQAVAAGKYFWALCEGEGVVLAEGAVAVGGALRISGTDGKADDTTHAATGDGLVYDPFAVALAAAGADELIQAMINVNLVISQVPVGPAPYQSGDRRPVGGTNPSII